MQKSFYIYELWDPIKNQIFYVGMAEETTNCPMGYRPRQHILEAGQSLKNGFKTRANRHKLNTINNIQSLGYNVEIKIVMANLSKNEAIQEEIRRIKIYGRNDLGNGTLTNLTDGGEGGNNMSSQRRKEFSESRTGKPSGKKGTTIGPYSDDRKTAIANGLKKFLSDNPGVRKGQGLGRTISDDQKKKISKTLKGRISPMKGKTAWNKGLTKHNDSRLLEAGRKIKEALKENPRDAWNKGKSMSYKGKTYEELYGLEKAAEIKEKRRLAKLKYWQERLDEKK